MYLHNTLCTVNHVTYILVLYLLTLFYNRQNLRCGTHIHDIRSHQRGRTKLPRSLQPRKKAFQTHPGGNLYTPKSSTYATARKATGPTPRKIRMNSAAMSSGLERVKTNRYLDLPVPTVLEAKLALPLPVAMSPQTPSKPASAGRPPLFGPMKPPSLACGTHRRKSAAVKHQYLAAYNKQYYPKHGKTGYSKGEEFNADVGTKQQVFRHPADSEGCPLAWKSELETPLQLYKTKFGRQDTAHSVTQVACFETTLFFLLKSDYLDQDGVTCLYKTNPLIPHLARMMDTLSRYDFRWIRDTDLKWKSQACISSERRK